MHASTSFEPRKGEIYAHTSLRGIASLGVVGYHGTLLIGPNALEGEGFVYDFMTNGYFFVDMFFVLSGFIMVENYAKRLFKGEDSTSLDKGAVLQFWWRRLFKILPNYYAALGIGLLVAVIANMLRDDAFPLNCLASSLVSYVFLVHELGGGVCYNINQPLWSIVTELLAYSCFPILIFLLRAPVLMPALAVCLYGMLFHYSQDLSPLSGFPSVVRTFAGFVLGMWLAAVHTHIPAHYKAWLQIPTFLAVIFAMAWGPDSAVIFAFVLLVLATASNSGALTNLSRQTWLYRLGRVSFSMYLVHVPLLTIFHLLIHKIAADTGFAVTSMPSLIISVAIACSLVVGFANYLWIEWPIECVARRMRGPLQSKTGA